MTSNQTHPADILVLNWLGCKPAAFDLTVPSPLHSSTLLEVGVTRGLAASAAEVRKHVDNNAKTWLDMYPICCQGAEVSVEAQQFLSQVASHLAAQWGCSNSKAKT